MSQQILSLPDFAEYLSRQPASKEYDPTDGGACLLFQYLQDRKLPVWIVGGCEWTDTSGREHDIPKELHHVAPAEPRTFGGALERTRAAMKAA